MTGSDKKEGESEAKMPATSEQVSKKRKVEEIKEGPQKNSDGDSFFDLGNKKRITVREFKGNVLIDIREFYNANGEMKPGKKGISLNPAQFEAFASNLEAIQKAVDALK